jgi:hypothetical protein
MSAVCCREVTTLSSGSTKLHQVMLHALLFVTKDLSLFSGWSNWMHSHMEQLMGFLAVQSVLLGRTSRKESLVLSHTNQKVLYVRVALLASSLQLQDLCNAAQIALQANVQLKALQNAPTVLLGSMQRQLDIYLHLLPP